MASSFVKFSVERDLWLEAEVKAEMICDSLTGNLKPTNHYILKIFDTVKINAKSSQRPN
jgi:hypothetical protein